jgi:hypothetical protein
MSLIFPLLTAWLALMQRGKRRSLTEAEAEERVRRHPRRALSALFCRPRFEGKAKARISINEHRIKTLDLRYSISNI